MRARLAAAARHVAAHGATPHRHRAALGGGGAPRAAGHKRGGRGTQRDSRSRRHLGVIRRTITILAPRNFLFNSPSCLPAQRAGVRRPWHRISDTADTLGRVSATLSWDHGCSECRSQATVPRLPRLGRAAVGRRSGRMWANRRSGQIGGAFRPKSSCASCQSGCNHHPLTGNPVIIHATARRSHTAAFWRHCRSLGRAHGCATSADPPFGASAHE